MLDMRSNSLHLLRKGELSVMETELSILASRLQRLEDDRAIRDLKARYLRCCDLRDPEGVRNTLKCDGAIIAYEGFPPFDNRDDFVDVFTQMGCQPGIFDIHHATNGVIAFESDTRATGLWSLHFQTIILANRSVTQMGVEYQDVYIREEGRWWIAETRTKRTLFLGQTVGEDGRTNVFALGEGPANFGDA
jgi:SnoaL-like domain